MTTVVEAMYAPDHFTGLAGGVVVGVPVDTLVVWVEDVKGGRVAVDGLPGCATLQRVQSL